MTKEEAENIGIKVAFKSVTIGILIAYLIPTVLGIGDGISAFFWIFDFHYWINIVIGISIFYACGYFFGKRAGNEILIKKKDYEKVGVKYGFFTLLITAFLSSWIGFFQEGIDNIRTPDDPFYDYIFKPMFWILFFGFFPSIFVGLLFGKRIKNKSEL